MGQYKTIFVCVFIGTIYKQFGQDTSNTYEVACLRAKNDSLACEWQRNIVINN